MSISDKEYFVMINDLSSYMIDKRELAKIIYYGSLEECVALANKINAFAYDTLNTAEVAPYAAINPDLSNTTQTKHFKLFTESIINEKIDEGKINNIDLYEVNLPLYVINANISMNIFSTVFLLNEKLSVLNELKYGAIINIKDLRYSALMCNTSIFNFFNDTINTHNEYKVETYKVNRTTYHLIFQPIIVDEKIDYIKVVKRYKEEAEGVKKRFTINLSDL